MELRCCATSSLTKIKEKLLCEPFRSGWYRATEHRARYSELPSRVDAALQTGYAGVKSRLHEVHKSNSELRDLSQYL